MRRLKGKLTYANVMATIAVFIALGGASYAAIKVPKNSVGPKQLKKNSVTGAKVKGDSLTGANINESTLATVPSAANAQTLGGLSSTQLTEASKVRCPSGMEPAVGVCFESATREPTYLNPALRFCGLDNLRLPTQGELIAFQDQNFSAPHEYEWATPFYYGAEGRTGAAVSAYVTGSSSALDFVFTINTDTHPYRCVTAASN